LVKKKTAYRGQMHGVFLFANLRALTGALGDEFSSGIEKERKKTKENLHERSL
jgi:hypothetical protein